MKVTALIPDELVAQVRELSHGKNLTDSLTIALTEWASTQRLRELTGRIKERPLVFADGFSADSIRKLNRS